MWCSSLHPAKSTDSESVPNSTLEDGPGDGFTILSAKSLFLGQKVSDSVLVAHEAADADSQCQYERKL